MKIFPNWRAVGRAMLDARRREGVTVTRYPDAWHGYEWDRNSADTVSVHTGQRGCSLMVDLAGGRHLEAGGMDAATVLRVLAALDLIPDHLAYAADERYGRCGRCGRLAQWWPAEAGSPARWVHVSPRLASDGLGYHRPEVAE
ncbi:MAG TPA: hypothetical protein VFY11_14780 [Nocardioidaceae bacterium]|nr:hypothetical protein [Nocardioidaceae bacterium]